MVALSSLPLETLEIITSHLADYKPSLYAVSQASRRCNAASKSRFRAITVRVSSPKNLETEIKSWHTILEGNLAFGAVRHLTISGRLFAIPADEADEQEEYGNPLPMVIVQHDQGEDELTRRGEVYDDILRGRFYHLGVKEELSDDPWKQVAGLLRRLTGLKEVVWACERWFPQPLLDVLHGIPCCKLHVKAFDPPRLSRAELDDDDDDPDDELGHDSEEDTGLQSCDTLKEGCVDDYEYRLATSPCLTSVVVPVAYDDPHRNSNEEAVQWMVRGLTPSLKHVHIIDSGPGFAYRTIPRASSGQYIVGDELDDEMGPGELESLSLDPVNEERFEAWEQAINFSRLRNLQLWRARRSTLARARLCDLSSLRTLALDVFNDRHSIDALPVDRAVAGFLTSLPRLESLHLTGPWSTETFTAVLQHHGRSLRTLSLHPSETRRLHQFLITPSKIQALGEYCPNLRDIRLQVKRSAGDQEEQEIYGAIAALPKVRHVSLQLDIYNPVKVGLPERSLQRDSEHVRQIFVNMAVDAKLAEEIARLIASQGRIETLTLDIGINVTGILGDVARYMKRQWKCFVVARDTVDLKVVVKEINLERRKRRQKGEADTKTFDFAKAFPSVWPQDVDLSDWRHAWHSFPLQKAEEYARQ